MSLVYEALRKAEREKERKTGTSSPVLAENPVVATKVPVLPQPAAVPVGDTRRLPISLYVLLSVVAVAATITIVWLVRTALVPAQESKPATVIAAPATAKPTEATPAPVEPARPATVTTANDPRFKLTGIMGKPGGGFMATINGRNVEEGHYIDGATVKSVERDRVTLEESGREFVVRLF